MQRVRKRFVKKLTFDERLVKQLIERELNNKVVGIARINLEGKNFSFIVKLIDYPDVVVRVSPEDRKVHNYPQLAWAYTESRKAGVPSPKVLGLGMSTDKFPLPYIIMERLPGDDARKFSFSREEKSKIVKSLGYYLSLIHSIKIEGFGQLVCVNNGSTCKGRHRTFVEYLSSELKNSWWAELILKNNLVPNGELTELEKEFRENSELFDQVYTSLIHRDMSPTLNNILVVGTEITGIVDMDLSIAADPALDFAYFSFYDKGSYKYFSVLKKGYRNKTVFSPAFEKKLLLLKLFIAYSLIATFFKRKERAYLRNAFTQIRRTKEALAMSS